MKNRTKAMLLALCLLLAFSCAALAEDELLSYDPLTVFTGVRGGIRFALPGAPERFDDADYEKCWLDSWQLMGDCAACVSEYQLRTADITPWIDWLTAEHPDLTKEACTYEAMLRYSTIVIGSYDGEVTNIQCDTEGDCLRLTFDYSYPDAPDTEYTAKALFDGTYVVALLTENCEHAQKALDALTPIPEGEEEETTPFGTYDFFGMTMELPVRPTLTEDTDGHSVLLCFAGNDTVIAANYFPLRVRMRDDAEAKKALQQVAFEPEDDMTAYPLAADAPMAENVMQRIALGQMYTVCADSLESGTLTPLGDGFWQYDYTAKSCYRMGDRYPTLWRGRIDLRDEGTWYFLANDTETGRAFLASLNKKNAPTEDAESTHMEDIIGEDADAAEKGMPLPQEAFLSALCDAVDSLGEKDALCVSDVMYSDGRWIRVADVGSPAWFAVLSLSSAQEDAQVNGVHLIMEADAAEAFSALNGAVEAILGGAYAAQDRIIVSAPVYQVRMLDAVRPEPLMDAPAMYAEGQDIAPIADPDVPPKVFMARWEALNRTFHGGQFPLESVPDLPSTPGAAIVLAGDGTMVQLDLTDEDAQSPIGIVFAADLLGDPPMAVAAGIQSLAALTGMPEAQYAALMASLLEYPKWGDLADMEPVAVWNGVYLLFTEMEALGQSLPAAFVCGAP